MLHSIKRATVGTMAARNEPTSDTFEDYRAALAEIRTAMEIGLGHIDSSHTKWNNVISDSASFYKDMANRYPTEDETSHLFHNTADSVHNSLRSRAVSLSGPESNSTKLAQMVRLYVAELKAVDDECSRTMTARKDYAMYHQKVEKLESKEAAPEKMDRNRDKFALSQAQYETLLNATIARMKTDYEKAPMMYRALYVAYGLHNGGMCELIPNEMKAPLDYCRSNEHELIKMMNTPSHVPSPTGTGMPSSGIGMTSSPTTTTTSYVPVNDHTMKM